ncbi:hypothetical protein Pfo_007867 [Paulownia fortunei]|nr:hypothetical protein Pfo_007867 [Paulownia fortunei]
MAYMLKGETEFDALKCIFQEKSSSENGLDGNEIIEISSDHDDDGRYADDPKNMYQNVGYEYSEGNTDNSFWNKITWYAPDSTSDASLPEVEKETEIDFADIPGYTPQAPILIPDGLDDEDLADDEGDDRDSEDMEDDEEWSDDEDGATEKNEDLVDAVRDDEVHADGQSGADDEPSSGVEDGSGVEDAK